MERSYSTVLSGPGTMLSTLLNGHTLQVSRQEGRLCCRARGLCRAVRPVLAVRLWAADERSLLSSLAVGPEGASSLSLRLKRRFLGVFVLLVGLPQEGPLLPASHAFPSRIGRSTQPSTGWKPRRLGVGGTVKGPGNFGGAAAFGWSPGLKTPLGVGCINFRGVAGGLPYRPLTN